MKYFLRVFFVYSIITNSSFAQNDSTLVKKDSIDYYDISLDQLINLKSHGLPSELEEFVNSLISVASKKPINLRESPSIISLITEEEIKKSGARDLIDVLRLVPGIDFAADIEGVVGIGMRGNWANEGKVLVLLDGQEMNEIISAGNMFGNHYPIEQIKKIEVIRGPGSAIYGGYAEYGVINIITRQAEDINGITISGTYGQMEKDYGRRNLNLSIGKKIKDFSFSLSGLVGQGQRSDQTYTDYADSSYSMKGNSNLNPNYFNLALGYKGLSFRAIGDFFQTTQRDGYGTVVQQGAVPESFNSFFSELKYVFKLNDKFTITPRINYKNQTQFGPQRVRGDGFTLQDKFIERHEGKLAQNLIAIPTQNRIRRDDLELHAVNHQTLRGLRGLLIICTINFQLVATGEGENPPNRIMYLLRVAQLLAPSLQARAGRFARKTGHQLCRLPHPRARSIDHTVRLRRACA